MSGDSDLLNDITSAALHPQGRKSRGGRSPTTQSATAEDGGVNLGSILHQLQQQRNPGHHIDPSSNATSSNQKKQGGGRGQKEGGGRGGRGGNAARYQQPREEAKTSSKYFEDELKEDILARTVHVRFLPVMMTKGELRALLDTVGELQRVRICGNNQKDQNWTYGFVQFKTADAAARAIKALHERRIEQFRLQCTPAKAIIADKFPVDASEEHMCLFGLKKHGPEQTLKDVIKHYNHEESAMEQQLGEGVTTPTTASDMVNPWKNSSLSSSTHGVASPVEGLALQLQSAAQKGVSFTKEMQQTSYYKAVSEVFNVVASAEEYLSGVRNVEVISGAQHQSLNSIDAMQTEEVLLCAQMLLIALHMMHHSYPDAVATAQEVIANLSAVEQCDAVLSSFTPYASLLTSTSITHSQTHQRYVCNVMVTIGLLLESLSSLISNYFFTAAQRRALLALNSSNKHVDKAVEEGEPLVTQLFPMLASTSQDSYVSYFFKAYQAAPTSSGGRSSAAVPQDGSSLLNKMPLMHSVVFHH